MEAYRRGIPIDTLPRTFQDAILITRQFGLRYLWIDSLCIVQDDEEDWRKESSAMASIYSNAYLTIAASNSFSDQHGFLQTRNAISPTNMAFKTKAGVLGFLDLTDWTSTRRNANHDSSFESEDPLYHEPLSSRAWALQERYLSRRILFFGSRQTMWECTELSETESGMRFEDRRHHHSLSLFRSSVSYALNLSDSQLWRFHICWYDIVQRYSACQLTKKTDRLPAISGIARKVGEKLWQTYCCGIWEGSLELGLLWSMATDNTPKESTTSCVKRRRPSWSWTSVDCGVTFGLLKYHSLSQAAPDDRLQLQEVKSLISSHNYKATFDGDHRYGPVRSATLDMLAPMVRLATSGTWEDSGKREYSINTMYDQPADHGRKYAYIVFLAATKDLLFGMIVEPICGHYRRIGIAQGGYMPLGPPNEPLISPDAVSLARSLGVSRVILE
jgi:hypothetical protein